MDGRAEDGMRVWGNKETEVGKGRSKETEGKKNKKKEREIRRAEEFYAWLFRGEAMRKVKYKMRWKRGEEKVSLQAYEYTASAFLRFSSRP